MAMIGMMAIMAMMAMIGMMVMMAMIGVMAMMTMLTMLAIRLPIAFQRGPQPSLPPDRVRV